MKSRRIPQGSYIAMLARETGASVIAFGRTRQEAQRRIVEVLEEKYRRIYAASESVTHESLSKEK